MGANRTTSSTKEETKSNGPETRPPLVLGLEILSIKVMNRIGDKGQPCRRPTCTRNRSDLVPAMRTKLLLRLYRDQMAHNKGPPIPYSWSTTRETVKCFHKVHKTHVYRLGKLP
ncbi:hypothetical protein CHARACLAT_022296 [Characodon lateralis]|uniref:Uncharacterized protein n=1 Tax=Characodon lateralis TaxID=208331 RepID=A0ABU7E5V9_9TELE|nr:hypothetical protein [Characodon lateralis]